MLQKIRKFIQLKKEEKKLFLESYIMLGLMRAAILTISFKRLACSLEHCPNEIEVAPLNEKEIHLAKSIGQAIARATSYTPWESTCLVQSLTAQRMLKKRNIPGVFYLGATKDNGSEKKIKAHAWSRCGETIVTGAVGREAFTVLSVFGWEKE